MNESSRVRHHTRLRGALLSLTASLTGALTVVGVLALFSVWAMNRAWEEGSTRAYRVRELAGLVRQAELEFKVEVQEWKNILLRGAARQDFSRYRQAFEMQRAEVGRLLEGVERAAVAMGLRQEIAQVRSLRADLATLDRQYTTALAAQLGSGASLPIAAAIRVDAEVRGADRIMEHTFEKLVSRMQLRAEREWSALGRELRERYASLRRGILLTLLICLAITGTSLYGALRATRQ